MFKKNEKSRIEEARTKVDKLRKNKHAREDLAHRLQRTVKDLRWEVEHLRDPDEQKRVKRIAHDLERFADNLEYKATKRIGDVTETAGNNIWKTALIALVLGVVIGIILKNGNDD